MKKGFKIALIVCVLLAVLCGAAMAEGLSNGTGTKASAGTDRVSFLSSPYLYGPSNVRISAKGLKARVSWTHDYGSYVTGYVVFQCKRSATMPSYLPYGWYTKRSDGYYWYPTSVIGTTTNNYMDITASSAGTYYIEVDSYYSSYYSYVSNVGGFATFKATNSNYVEAPQSVSAEQKGKNKVRVVWSAAEGAKSYAVYRATGSGNFVKIGTTKKTYYNDTKATNGKTFKYRIQAINGKKTKFSKTVKAYPMDKPTSVKAKSNGKGVVTVTWKKVKGAKKYLVYQRRPGSTDFTQVASVSGKTAKINVSYGDGMYKYYVVGAVGDFKGMKSSYASVNVYGATQSSTIYRALIVANTYTGNNTLYGTANDAVAMKGALKGMSQGWNVNVAQNVEASGILSAISSAFAGADADDVCLFYYSGHGVTSTGASSGALCGNSGYSYVKMSELASALDAACPGRVIVLLDSCGSGAGIDKGEGTLASMTQAAIDAFSARNKNVTDKYGELCGSKFTVLVAAKKHTTSLDLGTSTCGYNCGAFTYSLLTTLGASYPNGAFQYSMPGDTNNDRALSLIEAYYGICSIVSQHGWGGGTNQVTQYYGDTSSILFERRN